MTVYDYGHYFMVHIPFNQWFKRNVAAVKLLPYKWNPEKKLWWVPGECRAQIEGFKQYYRAEIVPGEKLQELHVLEIPPMPDLVGEADVQNITLRPYQLQGIARGMELKRYINGDEQGLGKTIQTIATISTWAQRGEESLPVLVICPASLKENWKREIEKFTNYKALILSDKTRNNWKRYYELGMAQFFIVNYESLKKYFVQSWPKTRVVKSSDITMIREIEVFKTIVIDEAHRCKDTTTQQTKLCLRIAHRKERVILLTGTPVVNKPVDLWPQICIMGQMAPIAATFKEYKEKYCEGANGARNQKALNALLNRNCFFRREKKDVAKDLPSKDRQKMLCEITTRHDYLQAESDFYNWLNKQDLDDEAIARKMRAEILTQMNVLRQISARGKIPAAKEFIDEVMESGEKLIVFVVLKEIVNELKRLYPDAVTITGSDDTTTRQRNIDAFQTNPKTQLIICNIKAAGVGITLTASSRVLFLEYPWTYADCVQCEDRAHRIGQTLPVMCTYLLGEKTIDEKMLDIILTKKSLAQDITGATDEMEMSVVDSLVGLFRKTA